VGHPPDSTSQALDRMKSFLFEPGIVTYYRLEAEKLKAMEVEPGKPPRLIREWYYRTHWNKAGLAQVANAVLELQQTWAFRLSLGSMSR
jgi:hypothetical protein